MQSRDKTPPHPGEVLLLEWVRPLSMNLRSLSEILDLSETELLLFLGGKMHLTEKLAAALQKWFCTSPNYWTDLQQAYNRKALS
jgi:addiction module HigA family antidote